MRLLCKALPHRWKRAYGDYYVCNRCGEPGFYVPVV